MHDLGLLGFGPWFSAQLSEEEVSSLVPGRAVADRGPRLLVRFAEGDRLVVVPGRLRAAGELPVVGDFVLAPPSPPGAEPEVIRVLERRTALRRGAAGRAAEEQILAANVDLVVVVHGLDAGIGARRLERTLSAVAASGAAAAVVLTKPDLCAEPAGARTDAEALAPGVPVLVASGRTGEGVEDLRVLLAPGTTAVLVGPSGAGKSTLVNALLGRDVQAVSEVREGDRRGRHTTTGRALLPVPGGGLLIDGPGLRELKLWDGEGLDAAFADLATLAERCRFRDCQHAGEPGCAVADAVEAGALDPARLESFHKLAREARAYAARRERSAAAEEKRRWRSVSRLQRQYKRLRGKG